MGYMGFVKTTENADRGKKQKNGLQKAAEKALFQAKTGLFTGPDITETVGMGRKF